MCIIVTGGYEISTATIIYYVNFHHFSLSCTYSLHFYHSQYSPIFFWLRIGSSIFKNKLRAGQVERKDVSKINEINVNFCSSNDEYSFRMDVFTSRATCDYRLSFICILLHQFLCSGRFLHLDGLILIKKKFFEKCISLYLFASMNKPPN